MILLRKTLRALAAAAAAIAVALSTRAEIPARIADRTFPIACAESAQPPFDLALALLRAHAFPLASRAFEQVLRRDPACAMGHWGIALVTLGDPRLSGPSAAGLAQGRQAAAQARAAGGKTESERELIEALAVYYEVRDERDHAGRLLRYERRMRQAREHCPDDMLIRELHSHAFEALTHH
jgi:hypothetical protein